MSGAITVVNSIQAVGNAPFTILPTQGTGNVTITSNIPTYTSSDGISRQNVSQVGQPPQYNFVGSYENIYGGPGINFTGNLESGYTIDAVVASINPTGQGITTTSDAGGNVTVNANIAGFTGPNPGISFSQPDASGIVTVTPNVCSINAGMGIGISTPQPTLAPNTFLITADVADVVQGAGISVSSSSQTNVYTVSANVTAVNSGSGVTVSDNAGSKTLSLNLNLPSSSGLSQRQVAGNAVEIDATYQNLLNGKGTTVNRTSGGAFPSASIDATVANINTLSKGITASADGNNAWTITNTGIVNIQSSTPAITTEVDSVTGMATLTFNPTQTFADEQVLNGSLQVPIVIGGKIQGSHFNGTLINQAINWIEPIPNPQVPGDAIVTNGTGLYTLRNGLIFDQQLSLPSGFNCSSFVWNSPTQSNLNPSINPFNVHGHVVPVYGYYAQASRAPGPGNPSGFNGYNTCGLWASDSAQVSFFFTSVSGFPTTYSMVPATGIATNLYNGQSLITGTNGIYIGSPIISNQPLVNVTPLVSGGNYSNPVITRTYKAVGDDPINAGRARCFCMQESGGLLEIPMYSQAPWFGTPVAVPGSPTGTGWYPLKVVPLEDQWISPSLSGDKFDYLIYVSSPTQGVRVYNTQTSNWTSVSISGFTGCFASGMLASFAVPGDTIYSQMMSGGLITSDVPPTSSGSFPTWTCSSQTTSVLFPTALGFEDVITFGSLEGYVYRSTVTPDITEILSDTLQVKSLNSILLLSNGDISVGSNSLEISNQAATLTSGIVDCYTESLAIHTGSIDMDSGTELNADLITGNILTIQGPVTLSNADFYLDEGTLRLGSNTNTILSPALTRYTPSSQSTPWPTYTLPHSIGFTVPLPGTVIQGQWSNVFIPFPSPFFVLSQYPAVSVNLIGNAIQNQGTAPQYTFQCATYLQYTAPPSQPVQNGVYLNILWTNGAGNAALQNPQLSIIVSG
jgi:hypothetical protein